MRHDPPARLLWLIPAGLCACCAVRVVQVCDVSYSRLIVGTEAERHGRRQLLRTIYTAWTALGYAVMLDVVRSPTPLASLTSSPHPVGESFSCSLSMMD